MSERESSQGVSPVVGMSLLIVVVLLLALVTTTMVTAGGFGPPQQTTLGSVEVDTSQRTAFVKMQTVKENADELEILVNGRLQRQWKNFSAGSKLPLFCLRPGDEIIVRQQNDDGSGQVVAEYEMEQRSTCRFIVSNDGNQSEVGPINWRSPGENVDEFYSYGQDDGTGHYHAHIDESFLSSNQSYIFFYEVGKEVALVVVHDQPANHTGQGVSHPQHGPTDAVDGDPYEDTAGGAVTMEFSGLPGPTSWTIQDDPTDDFGASCSNPPTKVCWAWAEVNTDGGAVTGGFSGDLSDLNVTVDATWDSNADKWDANGWTMGEMEDWVFVYRDRDGDLTAMNLTKDETVTIEAAGT